MAVERIEKTDEEWRQLLSPDQFAVLRQAATERPWSGEYVNEKTDGPYVCAACGNELFDAGTKYESGSGWPSFWEQVAPGSVDLKEDRSHGMVRTEVTCRRCGGHPGHLFDDGPTPSGQRYCIKSAALRLEPSKA